MDDFELEIKKEFISESLMNLEEVESSFMELESSADTKPLLDKIFRLAHNLKGGSRAVGFGSVAEFTHQLESLVLKIQKGEIALSSDIVTLLLRSNDRLVEMLSALKGNLDAQFENSDLLSELQKRLTLQSSPAEVEAKPAPVAEIKLPEAETETSADDKVPKEVTPPLFENFGIAQDNFKVADSEAPQEASISAQTSAAPIPPINAAAAVKQSNPEKNQRKETEDEVIRVNLSKIDLLNDYVGELIVLQSVVQQQASTQNNVKLHTSVRQVVKLCKDIQGLSMGLRMLPVKPLVQKLQRVVRDTAKALAKEVELEIIGDQLDIDKSVMDSLSDPLIHILRNAVDHGLENTEGRISAGKSKAGKVSLSLFNEGNHLIVEVRDDGKGINSEVLKKKALEKNIISGSQVLTEKQLIHLIFHPGFSTKSETSEISGRGVGMDVVKTNLEKIGGTIEVQTIVGSGSHFKMQIPLSLAVIEGLIISASTDRYVIPLTQVQETINLKNIKIHESKAGLGPCIELRKTVIPLISIQEALTSKSYPVKKEDTVLIVNVEDRAIGLSISDIVSSQQIVVKPLKNGILPQKGWIGSCVLGDGLPTLILSPSDLLAGRIANSQGEEYRLEKIK